MIQQSAVPAAVQQPQGARKARHWRKWVQVVGLILLAVVCPFAAMFMGPSRRGKNHDDAPIEGER